MNVLYDISSVLAALSNVFGVWLVCSLKIALLLAGAGMLTAGLRNTSASMRHWIWTLAMGGALIVSGLTVFGPSWPVALPGFGESVSVATEPVAPSSSTPAPAPPAQTAPEAATMAAEAPAASSSMPSLSWMHWGLLGWTAGALLVLLYFAVGSLRARRWSRQAEPVTDYPLLKQADRLSDKLGLQRPVRLLWSERAAMPMTWGLLRPVVLLPRRAEEWTEERRRVVLTHELAHIRRWDGLTQFVAQLVCVLHWFNPLVWWGARQLRIERERACDDVVLTHGNKASTYADHLLNIARSYAATPGRPLGAVSMAKRSQLEHRLLAILESDKPRRTLNQLSTGLSALLALALIVPLAALRPAPPASSDAETVAASPAPVAPAPSTPSASSAQSMPPAASDDVIRRTFEVRPGGTLDVRSDRGSIEVRSHAARTVKVEVHREADDEDALEHFKVAFEKQGNDVHVRGEGASGGWFNWGNHDLQVRYVVTVPRRYNANLKTAGGSIAVGDLEGKVTSETAGGSLRLGHIQGDVRGKTAGGSIQLSGANGNAWLKTAGGSIKTGDVTGNVEAKTAGGSISLGIVRGTVHAKTAGGSISVEEVGGQIDASTSGGSITARIAKQPQGDSKLKTTAGSVTVYLAEDVGVDLDAEASLGRVKSSFHPNRGEEEEHELKAKLNGGGPRLELRSTVGNVSVKRTSASTSSLQYDALLERLGQYAANWPEYLRRQAHRAAVTTSQYGQQAIQHGAARLLQRTGQWLRGMMARTVSTVDAPERKPALALRAVAPRPALQPPAQLRAVSLVHRAVHKAPSPA